MNQPFLTCVAFVVCLAVVAGAQAQEPPGKAGRVKDAAGARDDKRVVGYYTSWSVYDRGFEVAEVRGERLTHLNYAFAKIIGGKCVPADPWADVQRPTKKSPSTRGNFRALQRLKQKHPHLKTLISIGGWTLSGPFSDVALTAASRKQFATSCIEFIDRHQFDGLDLDWEYPVDGGKPGNRARPEDKQNYTRLLAEVRRQLDLRQQETGRRYLLTIAVGARPEMIRNLEMATVAKHVDWVNLMAYDYQGGWSRQTSFHAPLYHPAGAPGSIDARLNADTAVRALIDASLPRDKLVLGIPFYGRGWKQVPSANHGLFQTHQGAMPSRHEPGLIPYRELLKRSGFKQHWHAKARASWSYNATTREMVVGNDQRAVTERADYIIRQRLGGAMVWELGHDVAGDRSLLETLSQKLRGAPQAAP